MMPELLCVSIVGVVEVVKATELVGGVANEVYVNPVTSYICCRPDVRTHGAISPQYGNGRLS